MTTQKATTKLHNELVKVIKRSGNVLNRMQLALAVQDERSRKD